MCSVNRNKSEGSVIKITAVVNKNWDYGIYKIYIYMQTYKHVCL